MTSVRRLLFVVLAPGAIAAAEGQKGEVVSYSLPERVTLGEPVILDVTIRNDLADDLFADFGLSSVQYFQFDIVTPAGARRTVRPLGRDGFQPSGRFQVSPGDSLSTFVVLNEWMDLPDVGKYSLGMRFAGHVGDTRARAVEIPRQASWEFEIASRNQDTLRRRCADLLEAIRKPGTDGAERAYIALAHTFDPVAIPFLKGAAEVRPAASEAIQALVRIGGPEARTVLETLSANSNAWTAGMAKNALHRIK